MTFDNTYSLSDIINILSLILVIIGGIFAFIQWKNTLSLRRASFINELTEKIRTDSDIRHIIYLLDYGDSWYSESFHKSPKLERKMDKTLSYFSYICYLRKQNLIGKDDFMFFRYEIERILMNTDVKDYLYNLYHFSAKFNIPFTFYYLLDYAKSNNLFEAAFYDNTSYQRTLQYHHYLNF